MFGTINRFFNPLPAAPAASEPIAPTETRSLTSFSGPTEQRSTGNFTLQSQEAQRLFVFGTPSTSGVAVNNDTLLSLSPAFAAIRLISQGVAMMDRKVKKRKKNGVFDAEKHPVAVLMNGRPHPHYTWFDMIAAWVTNACMGNGYLLIHWDEMTMRPWALEHIPQGLVWLEYDIYGGLWYRISGQINGMPINRVVPSTDMLHLKGLTTNGINGRPIAFTHRSTIGAGIAKNQYAEATFGNGARPSIAVKYAQPLNSKERSAALTRLKKEISGVENGGNPLLLDDGMSVKYLQWSPNDVALVDFSTLNAEDCCRIWGVPREHMALDSHGTRGAAMQKSQDLLTHCFGPWMEKIQEEINSKLFSTAEIRSGKYFFEFDSSMFLSLDKQAEANTLSVLVKGSMLTPNEARNKLGHLPMVGGDELYGDINSIPLKNIVEVALAKYLSAVGEKGRNDAANQAQGVEDAAKVIQDKPGQKTQTTTANNQNDTVNAPTGQP